MLWQDLSQELADSTSLAIHLPWYTGLHLQRKIKGTPAMVAQHLCGCQWSKLWTSAETATPPLLFFWDRISLCSPGWPPAEVILTARVTGVSPHAQLRVLFKSISPFLFKIILTLNIVHDSIWLYMTKVESKCARVTRYSRNDDKLFFVLVSMGSSEPAFWLEGESWCDAAREVSRTSYFWAKTLWWKTRGLMDWAEFLSVVASYSSRVHPAVVRPLQKMSFASNLRSQVQPPGPTWVGGENWLPQDVLCPGTCDTQHTHTHTHTHTLMTIINRYPGLKRTNCSCRVPQFGSQPLTATYNFIPRDPVASVGTYSHTWTHANTQ